MAIARVKQYEPRLSVELEGIGGRLPAVRFNSSFELNAIPMGTVSIAVGNEFRAWAPSPIHAVADALAVRRKIRVLLAMEPAGGGGGGDDRGNPALGIGAGEFVVFDGFTGAVGASMANGAAQFNVQLVHWLDDLNFSSVFSKTSHPANLGDYTFGALSGGDAGQAGGGPDAPAGRNWIGLTHAMRHFVAGNIESDLWLEAIKPWFEELCGQDAFEANELGLEGGGGNGQALAALARMGAGPCYVPLALDLDVDEDLGDDMAQSASRMTQDPEEMAHITIWDALVAKFGAEYIFAVVPLIERAMVVPFVPGYRTAFKVIPAAQETQVEWTNAISRTLRGMGVMTTMEMVTGANLGPPNVDYNIGIGGFYSPDPDGPGQIQTRGGPDWLTRFSASRHSDEAVGAAGRPIPDALAPDVPVQARGQDAEARARKIKPFLNTYAQALYALEMIRGRQAVAAGPVRFDIAPGSTVLVYPGGDPGIGDDKLRAPFYATVMRVSTHLDAEAAQAGTGFHLAHCRSETENTSDRTSVAKHPIYKNTFDGCSLVDVGPLPLIGDFGPADPGLA